MDPEKVHEMRELLEKGRPVTDEGPFYHHATWESYKGGVKGKLGGGLLGSVIGAGVGLAFVAALPIAGITLGAAAAGTAIAGFSAAGLMYAAHEFGDVGKVAGAVAAVQKDAEHRGREYTDSRLNEIKEDIAELKALQKGEPAPEKKAEAETAAIKAEQDNYRTTHLRADVADTGKIVYWKVAAIGLAVGIVAGAILAFGGAGPGVLHFLGMEAVEAAAGGAAHGAAAVTLPVIGGVITAMAAVGASFGINRDVFRAVFDRTDLLFRGFLSHEHSKQVLLGEGKGHAAGAEKALETVENAIKTTKPKEVVMYDGQGIQYPDSDTFHRDRVIAAGQKALVEMNPASMSKH